MNEKSPPNKILLLKLIIAKLVPKPLTYGALRLTALFTIACHLSLSPAG